MVFFGHLTGGLMLHVYRDEPTFILIAQHVNNLGAFGVELFFVISGYVIANSAIRYSFTQFWARRLVRLYPLFFFVTIVFFLANAALKVQPSKDSLMVLLKNLLFIDLFFPDRGLSPNAWSISYEIWYYLFAALFVMIIRQRGFVLLGLLTVAFLGFIIVFPITIYFCLGVATFWLRARYGMTVCRRACWVGFGMVPVLVIVASTRHFEYPPSALTDPFVWIAILSTWVFFVALTESDSPVGKMFAFAPLRFAGSISYSLYLIHPYTYFAWRAAFNKFGVFSTLSMLPALLLFFAANIVAAIIVSWIVNVVLERKPYEMIFGSSIYH